MFLGIFTTLCIPETKRKTLEELSLEEEAPAVVRNGSEESEGQPEKNG